MSIAVAVQKGKQIVIASDSQSSFGSCRVPPENHQTLKIRKAGSSYIAAAGWAIYDDMLQDFLSRRKLGSLRSREAIFRLFLQFWKEAHKRYSIVNDQPGEKDSPFGELDSSFLIVNSAGIFHVSSDMSTTKFEKYFAIGSGGDYALGALHALYDSELGAVALAQRAVEAAIAFNVYCGGEIRVEKMRLR